MSDNDVYIIDCVRTPVGVGRESGALHSVHPVNLLAQVLDAVTARLDVNKSEVEDVICGVVSPLKEQGSNIPRISLLKAGYPVTVPAVQLNRMCGSGQQAIHFGCQEILSGDMDVVIGCGVEMMGTVKMGSDGDPNLITQNSEGKQVLKFGDFPFKLVPQGLSAELIAEKYKISRQEMDEFAMLSHKKCFEATKNGYFKSQILPIKYKKTNKDGTTEEAFLTHDEGIRYPVDKDKLTSLPTIFKKNGGGVTAGNASQISDGAAAVLLMSGKKANKLGLKKRARVVARAVVGSDPVMMLDGIIPATQKVLKMAGLTVEDIDVFEANEAFASVVLSWKKTLNVPMEKINPNGGAIAHGHPLGASGAVLMTKLVNELERTGKRYGLQTMCIGHGQATATIIENCSYKSKL